MTNGSGIITLNQARQMAEDAVMRDRSQYKSPEVQKALEDEFLEAENCWIFLEIKKLLCCQKTGLRRLTQLLLLAREARSAKSLTLTKIGSNCSPTCKPCRNTLVGVVSRSQRW
jgi:hypothetical protein